MIDVIWYAVEYPWFPASNMYIWVIFGTSAFICFSYKKMSSCPGCGKLIERLSNLLAKLEICWPLCHSHTEREDLLIVPFRDKKDGCNLPSDFFPLTALLWDTVGGKLCNFRLFQWSILWLLFTCQWNGVDSGCMWVRSERMWANQKICYICIYQLCNPEWWNWFAFHSTCFSSPLHLKFSMFYLGIVNWQSSWVALEGPGKGV